MLGSALGGGSAAALLLVAGLVFDGGRMIAARRDADAVAAAAARAGAQGLDEAGVAKARVELRDPRITGISASRVVDVASDHMRMRRCRGRLHVHGWKNSTSPVDNE